LKKHLVIAAAVALLPAVASAAQVWTAPSTTKVRPQAAVPADPPTAAVLAAARNEFESFHVVVNGPASGISMSLSGLSDGKGSTISGRDVVLYREALINVPAPSGGDGAAGWWPDALVPDVDPIAGEKRNAFPFDVPAGETRSVFVDIHVPEDAPAGIYTGVVNVAGGVSASVPVTLTVWDFKIPSTATLISSFGLNWNGPCMGHGDPGCTNYPAEQALRARYVQAALDNRVSISNPDISGPVKADGSQDWSNHDKYAGPFLSGTAGTRLKGAKLTSVQVWASPSTVVEAAWATHFHQKGWFDALFAYTCDEPPLTCRWSDIPTLVNQTRAADPVLPTLVTTLPATATANGVPAGAIDRFVIVVNYMEDRPGTQYAGNQRAKYPANIWLYQGCMSFGCSGVSPGVDATNASGWPSYALDTAATRNRALEWMSFNYDASGELYYEMTQSFSTGDPWATQYAFGGQGDGTLFYPGTTNRIGGQTEIPIESLRLKGIRDGMEDYELLHLAASLGLKDQAKAISFGLYPHAYQAAPSPADVGTARAKLAALILHALGKDVPPGGGSGTGSDAGTGTGIDAGTGTGIDAGTGTGIDGGGSDGGIGTGGGSSASNEPSGIPVATSGLGYAGGGGCSTSGPQSAWLGLGLLAAAVLRRRRTARG